MLKAILAREGRQFRGDDALEEAQPSEANQKFLTRAKQGHGLWADAPFNREAVAEVGAVDFYSVMVLSPVSADSLEAFGLMMFVHISLTLGRRTRSAYLMGLPAQSRQRQPGKSKGEQCI